MDRKCVGNDHEKQLMGELRHLSFGGPLVHIEFIDGAGFEDESYYPVSLTLSVWYNRYPLPHQGSV